MLRPGHGARKGTPHIEIPILRSLPQGVPGDTSGHEEPLVVVPRDRGGHLRSHEAASRIGRLGGLAKAKKAKVLKVLERLGIHASPAELQPYYADAEEFGRLEVARLAQVVGGGHCGAAPATMIQTAAAQLAGSRYCFSVGDLALGSRLGDSSRQNLLAAHELCAREAEARAKTEREGMRGSPLAGLLST